MKNGLSLLNNKYLKVVDLIIESWGDLPKKSAKQTIEKYGLPNEASQSRLTWYNNGPWKRTVVYVMKSHIIFPSRILMLLRTLLIIKCR